MFFGCCARGSGWVCAVVRLLGSAPVSLSLSLTRALPCKHPPKHPPPTHAPQTPQLLALELLILLLEAPSDDSVEVAVDFLKVRAVEGASEGTGGARCRHQRAPQRPTHLH